MADLAELWGAAIAQPEDDGLRAVLADALQAAEDPRGELIALQLLPSDDEHAPARRDRIQALLAEWGVTWLGRLAKLVSGAHFDRGLLDRIELRYPWPRAARWQAVFEEPTLATVEDVLPGRTLDNDPDVYRRLLTSPALRRLRRIEIRDPAWLDVLDARIEHVAVNLQDPTAAPGVVARLADIPSVTSLAFRRVDFEVFAASSWFDRIRHLTVAGAVRPSLDLWRRMPPGATLAIVSSAGLAPCSFAYPWDHRVELVPSPAGLVARVSGEWLLASCDALTALPADTVRIEIEHTSDAMAERIRALLSTRGVDIRIRRATWHGNLALNHG